jgi:hypothetical protein
LRRTSRVLFVVNVSDRQTVDEFIEDLIDSSTSDDSSYHDRINQIPFWLVGIPLFEAVGSLSMSSSSSSSRDETVVHSIECSCGCKDLQLSDESGEDNFQWCNEVSYSTENGGNTELASGDCDMSSDQAHAEEASMDISLGLNMSFEVTINQVVPKGKFTRWCCSTTVVPAPRGVSGVRWC